MSLVIVLETIITEKSRMPDNTFAALCSDGNWWIISYDPEGEVCFHMFLGENS